jgi:hypothetical protein
MSFLAPFDDRVCKTESKFFPIFTEGPGGTGGGVGPKGETGATGPQGPTGPQGATGVVDQKGLYCLKTSNQTITNTLTKISFAGMNTNFNDGFTVDIVNSKIVCNHTNNSHHLIEIEAQISTQIPQQIQILQYINNLPENNMAITQYINSSGSSTQMFRMSGQFIDILSQNDFIEFFIVSESNTTPSPTLTTSTTLSVPTITIPSFKIVITEL